MWQPRSLKRYNKWLTIANGIILLYLTYKDLQDAYNKDLQDAYNEDLQDAYINNKDQTEEYVMNYMEALKLKLICHEDKQILILLFCRSISQ